MTEVEKKVEEKKPTVSNSSRLMLLVSRLNKMVENLAPSESDFVLSTLVSLRSVEATKRYQDGLEKMTAQKASHWRAKFDFDKNEATSQLDGYRAQQPEGAQTV